jgi:hypothetical protein
MLLCGELFRLRSKEVRLLSECQLGREKYLRPLVMVAVFAGVLFWFFW